MLFNIPFTNISMFQSAQNIGKPPKKFFIDYQ